MNAFLIIKLFPPLLMVVGYFNKNKDIKISNEKNITYFPKKEKRKMKKKDITWKY